MKVHVTYYGLVADCVGKSNETLELGIIQDTLELRPFFEHIHPELVHSTYKIAVNQTLKESIKESEVIYEIALLPPFAGG